MIEARKTFNFLPGPYLNVYVVLSDEPNTMFVHWHTPNESESTSQLYIRKSGSSVFEKIRSSTDVYAGTDRTIHTVKLSNLESDQEYRIKVHEYGALHWFKTLPENPSEIKIAEFGDMWLEGFTEETVDMFEQVAKSEADVILGVGDWCHADGRPERSHLWLKFWDLWYRNVRSDNKLIPIIPGIGNHEIPTPRDEPREKEAAQFFYKMFGFPQNGYGVVDFGELLSIIVLDSHHTNYVQDQTDWLEGVLSQRTDKKHIIPTWHVASYPSGRTFEGVAAKLIREHWHPKIEQNNNVKIAFEHHDHCLKRTVPIRNGVEDPTGIIYLGDGAIGSNMRYPHNPSTTWYLELAKGRSYVTAESGEEHPDDGKFAGHIARHPTIHLKHFNLVTVNEDSINVKAINRAGIVLLETTV